MRARAYNSCPLTQLFKFVTYDQSNSEQNNSAPFGKTQTSTSEQSVFTCIALWNKLKSSKAHSISCRKKWRKYAISQSARKKIGWKYFVLFSQNWSNGDLHIFLFHISQLCDYLSFYDKTGFVCIQNLLRFPILIVYIDHTIFKRLFKTYRMRFFWVFLYVILISNRDPFGKKIIVHCLFLCA